MRILIIGGTGYIGSYLVHKFSHDGRIEEIYYVETLQRLLKSL